MGFHRQECLSNFGGHLFEITHKLLKSHSRLYAFDTTAQNTNQYIDSIILIHKTIKKDCKERMNQRSDLIFHHPKLRYHELNPHPKVTQIGLNQSDGCNNHSETIWVTLGCGLRV